MHKILIFSLSELFVLLNLWEILSKTIDETKIDDPKINQKPDLKKLIKDYR